MLCIIFPSSRAGWAKNSSFHFEMFKSEGSKSSGGCCLGWKPLADTNAHTAFGEGSFNEADGGKLLLSLLQLREDD